jgi:hypothetical protein
VPVTDELRIPIRWEQGKDTIQIDGVTYRREMEE